MRRPRFHRWIRSEVLRLSGYRRFNLRELTAFVQRERSTAQTSELCAALLLYAHANGCLPRLHSFLYDEDLLAEYRRVEQHLGQRSIERLALRGTPMRSLPSAYCNLMEGYSHAYHAPETIAAEKRSLLEATRRNVLAAGISSAALARQMGVDPGNLNAYLSRGETHRFTLETARRIAAKVA